MDRWFKITLGILIVFSIVMAALFFRSDSFNPPTNEPTFKVGVVVPLSGRNARYGQWIREGLQLAADHINETGGVRGTTLDLIFEDDQADPGQAVSALNKLISVHNIEVIYGSWASSSVLAMAPLAERENVVVLASAISPQISEAGDYIFRMQPSARQYILPLAPYAIETLEARKAAVMFINNDFGRDQAEVFGEAFEALGGEVMSSDGYESTASDFRAELTKLRALDIDVAFLASYAEIAQILRQAEQLGLGDITFLGSVPTENPDLFSIAGEAAEGIVFPSHFNNDDPSPAMTSFVGEYSERFGETPEGLASLAYDGLFAIREAVELADSFEGPDIKDAMYQVKLQEGVTGTTSFDDNGDVLKTIILKTVRDGRFVALEMSTNE